MVVEKVFSVLDTIESTCCIAEGAQLLDAANGIIKSQIDVVTYEYFEAQTHM